MEFAHVALLVSDVDQSAEWYAKVFGWRELFRADQPSSLGEANGHGGAGRIVMGIIDTTRVEFVEMHDADVGPWRLSDNYGLMLISTRVPDLAPVRANLERHGVPVKRAVRLGGSEFLALSDPDGIEVGITGPAAPDAP